SRNVPAVSLAAQLSHPNLYEFLRRAGVPLPEPESHYGLALPLGAAEVTMQDLVRLYAALANNGELRPLRHISRDPLPRTGPRLRDFSFKSSTACARTGQRQTGHIFRHPARMQTL